MGENNGKFIRGIFWTLILASFAWGTTVLFISTTALSAHCKDADAKVLNLDNKMVARDETMLKEIMVEFKEINAGLSEQRSDIKWIKDRIANR